jgi:predicted nucleic acid-binding protein
VKTVFADSVYFFAVRNANDRLHKRAVRYAAEGADPILTTAWVLTEVADGVCHRSAPQAAVRLWQTLEAA